LHWTYRCNQKAPAYHASLARRVARKCKRLKPLFTMWAGTHARTHTHTHKHMQLSIIESINKFVDRFFFRLDLVAPGRVSQPPPPQSPPLPLHLCAPIPLSPLSPAWAASAAPPLTRARASSPAAPLHQGPQARHLHLPAPLCLTPC